MSRRAVLPAHAARVSKRRGFPRNAARDQVVLRRCAAGESQTSIAQSLGVSRQWINKIVAHYGLTNGRGRYEKSARQFSGFQP